MTVGILRSMSIGCGGLSAPTTTPSKRSLHPEASIRMVLSGRKQSSAKLYHSRFRDIGGLVFLPFAIYQVILGESDRSHDSSVIFSPLQGSRW